MLKMVCINPSFLYIISFQETILETSSINKRKESTPLLEKIKTDVSLTKLKLNSSEKKNEKPKDAKEEPPIIKYLSSQVSRLYTVPFMFIIFDL